MIPRGIFLCVVVLALFVSNLSGFGFRGKGCSNLLALDKVVFTCAGAGLLWLGRGPEGMSAARAAEPLLEAEPYVQSARWEQSRIKRTVAIKAMEKDGTLKVYTDDAGNQVLSLPWVPNRKVAYKSLSLQQRLINEVCAGAFGEISKDVLLHSVDTAKTRRQAQKKLSQSEAPTLETVSNNTSSGGGGLSATDEPTPVSMSPLAQFKDLYSGFPVVLASSIPQGGMFFLTKKAVIEGLNFISPAASASVLGQALPIGLGVCTYWLFRTPAEVLKTQVQTKQLPNIAAAIEQTKAKDEQGLRGLWRYYPVMLCLDVPFQVVNFILYGALSEAVLGAGYPSSLITRLLCGTTCGMIAAGLTCPIDVCKTRIISRDKALQEARFKARARGAEGEQEGEGEGEGGGVSLVTGTSSAPLEDNNSNVLTELISIYSTEGPGALFLGIRQRLAYTGLANGIRLAAYGTSRMDLMMRSLDDL